jgi:aldehyde dehydrogenase
MTNNPPSTRIQPGEYGFPLKLKARYDNFIGGDWVAPADGDYYQNLTPVTGQPLCEIASSGKRQKWLNPSTLRWWICALPNRWMTR